MGVSKIKWSHDEEEALRNGVKQCVCDPVRAGRNSFLYFLSLPISSRPIFLSAISRPRRYGLGKWRHIQKDPILGKILTHRSNVDLKASVLLVGGGKAGERPGNHFRIPGTRRWACATPH